MRITLTLLVATLVTMLAPLSALTADAAPAHHSNPKSSNSYHPKWNKHAKASCSSSAYVRYASAVYHRPQVSKAAQHHLWALRACLRPWSIRFQHQLSRARENRRRPWSTATASWYEDSGQTASGTHPVMNVANKTLPFGTRLEMCGSRCTIVTVGDRGPFVAGREFDLGVDAKNATGCGDICTVRFRSAGHGS